MGDSPWDTLVVLKLFVSSEGCYTLFDFVPFVKSLPVIPWLSEMFFYVWRVHVFGETQEIIADLYTPCMLIVVVWSMSSCLLVLTWSLVPRLSLNTTTDETWRCFWVKTVCVLSAILLKWTLTKKNFLLFLIIKFGKSHTLHRRANHGTVTTFSGCTRKLPVRLLGLPHPPSPK